MSNNILFQFEEVKREKCKASILIEGLTGKGKSGLALVLGYALANHDWSKVYNIDTENKSIQLFEGLESTSGVKFEKFKIANFTPELGYKPSNYEAFKKSAIATGAEVIIQDSISHAWQYQGGVLDMINELKKSNKRYERDPYAAWGDEKIVKEKQKLFQLFRDHNCHIISTVRVKEKMEYDKDASGKTVLNSLGEQEIMQADIKYEPDCVLHMIRPGKRTKTEASYPVAKVVKSRYAILTEGEQYEFTPQLCDQIREYLEEGTAPEILLEQQRLQYVDGIKEFLDINEPARNVWNALKQDRGLKDVALKDLNLKDLKEMFVTLTV